MCEQWVICHVTNAGETRLWLTTRFPLGVKKLSLLRRGNPPGLYRMRQPYPGEDLTGIRTIADLVNV